MNPASENPVRSAEARWNIAAPVSPEKLDTGYYKFGGLLENRGQERISQRELGLVKMFLRPPGKETWFSVRLWDFTSISFGIYYGPDPSLTDAAETEAPKPSPLPLQVGDEVELRIHVTHHQEFGIWCEVKNILPWKGGFKMGLRRLDVNFPQSVEVERREAERLQFALALALNARIKHPFLFGHWCRLKVADINSNMGLSLVCTDPSILIFEGMELKLHFELASLRSVPMDVRVAWVHATRDNEVKFGVVCLDMDWKLHNGMCEFLLFSRQWTPARLRSYGFLAQQVKSRLRFRTVKTMEDYAEVLHLRRDAYVGAAKKPEGTRAEAMAGRLDGISRILMVRHNEKLVGTMTFTYPTDENTLLDSQAGFPGCRYPVHLPPKANLIEVSRLCIHGDYRSTDLLQGLFEHGIKHFLMSDRHWLLTSATEELLPTYLRIGFVKLKASYKHPGLNNREHHLILAHRSAFLMGKGMNLLVWTSLFGDVVAYLLDRKLTNAPAALRLFIRAKLTLHPWCKRLLENRAHRGFKQHLEAMRRAETARSGAA